MKKSFFGALLCPALLFSAVSSALSEEEFLNRIDAHFIIGDYERAFNDAKQVYEQYPHSSKAWSAYIRSLPYVGEEISAVRMMRSSPSSCDPVLIEEVAWGILRNGVKSSQYNIKYLTLLGAYFTRDARAVKLLFEGLKDENAVIRNIALRLSSYLGDEPFKRFIMDMLKMEKSWRVRLEAIRAVGRLRLKSAERELKKIASGDGTYEERAAAIEALISIYDDISQGEFERLIRSPKAGLRLFAIKAALYFEKEKCGAAILNACFDPINDVRVEAINAIPFLKGISEEDLKTAFERLKTDTNPEIAITASWAALVKFDDQSLKKWLFVEDEVYRRFAAAAVAAAGKNGVTIAIEGFEKSADPYVRANLALGLLGQKVEEKRCCDELFLLLEKRKELLMWDSGSNEHFRILAPSRVEHIEEIANYPEIVDQSLELELLSILAVKEDGRAEKAIRSFLQKKRWGLTGMAALTLLKEGNEESLKLLKSLLNDPEKNVRCQAALVLAVYGKDESAIPFLEEAYNEADRELKVKLLEALCYVGKENSYNFFLKAMEEPFQALRIIAASGVIQAIYR